jgi:hypothetical protein
MEHQATRRSYGTSRKPPMFRDMSVSETSMATAAHFTLAVGFFFGKCRVVTSGELQRRGSEQGSREAQFKRRSDLPGYTGYED